MPARNTGRFNPSGTKDLDLYSFSAITILKFIIIASVDELFHYGEVVSQSIQECHRCIPRSSVSRAPAVLACFTDS